MPQTQSNPFASYSADQQASIREQLTAAMESGKLNPAQRNSVARALASSNPQAGRSGFSLASGLPMHDPGAVAGYVGKEAAGGVGDVLAGLGKMVFQPPQTKTEKYLEPLGPGTVQLKRLLEGMIPNWEDVKQVPGAIRDLRGNPNALPAIGLQMPRVLGQVATMQAIPAVVEGAAKIPGKVSSGARIGLQELAGAGKEPVYLENVRRAGIAKERLAAHEKTVADVSRDNAQKLQEHAEKVKKAQDSYQKELAEYQKATAEKKTAHAEKVKQARQEWVQKSFEAKRLKAQADQVQGQLESLKRGQDAYAKLIKSNVDQTFQTVKSRLGARWDDLRDKINPEGRPPATLNSVKINDAIEAAKQRYLVGSPENLKVFSDLMRQMQFEGDTIDASGGGVPGLRPLTWNEGRVHYSALGDKIYSGDLPGNVSLALRSVRDILDKQLSDVAQSRGLGKVYSTLKSDWAQFESDWKDMTSVAGGGSPLARVIRAQDPGFVSAQVLGKAGERMTQTLAKYKEDGGNPSAVAKLRTLNTRAKELPKIKVPSSPGKLELPAEPKLGEAPEPKPGPKSPKSRVAKAPELPSTLDPIALRRKKLTELAGRPFGWFDLFPPRLIEHLAMKNPEFREWVARQPRQELPEDTQ